MKNEKFLGYHVSYESAPEDVLGEMRWVTTFIEDIDQAKRIAEGAVEHATEETKFVYVYGVTGDEAGNIGYYEATKIRAWYDEEEEEEDW